MSDDKEEIKEAFKIIQTQILELQRGMNTFADAMIELAKKSEDIQATGLRRFKVVCDHCEGTGHNGNCDWCEGSGYNIVATKCGAVPLGATEEMN